MQTKAKKKLIILLSILVLSIIAAGTILLTITNNKEINKIASVEEERIEGLTSSDGNWYYTVNSDQTTATITTYSGTNRQTIVIPSTIDGYTITNLRYEIFKDYTSLENVTMPDTLIEIPGNAFARCTKLKSVIIPDSVITTGDGAFKECTSLENVTIGNSVTTIGNSAFKDCTSLKNVTIGNSVTTIGNFAFGNCTKLTNVEIPNSVTTINDAAFDACASLTEITIPNSVTTIKTSTFRNCQALRKLTIPRSVVSIDQYAFLGSTNITIYCYSNSYAETFAIEKRMNYILLDVWEYEVNADGVTATITKYIGSYQEVDVPNIIDGYSITAIGDCAFQNCTSLQSVTIPSSIITMGDFIFDSCSSLREVTIMNGVTTLGIGTFWYCTSLNNVVLPNTLTTLDHQTFYGCTSLSNITIPNTVTVIGEETFKYCETLRNIVIPNSVTIIGESAFEGCTGLTSATLPNTLTILEKNLFKDCTSLTGVEIPNTVTEIKSYAFQSCTSLEDITIPNSVTTIQTMAFYNCTALESITIPRSVTNINGYILYGDTDVTIYCYSNSTAQAYAIENRINYILIDIWEYEVNSDGITATITKYNGSDTAITIPSKIYKYTITKLGMWIFEDNTDIVSVVIPNTVTEIKQSAFENCSELTSVVLPNAITEIGIDVFHGCTALTNITIPNSVTLLNTGAFMGCTSLTEITIPNSVTIIGNNTFDGCTSLEEIVIPDSVIAIGDWAFRGCTSLGNITIPASVTDIYMDILRDSPNACILCYKNSTIHTYAKQHIYNYVLLDALKSISVKTLPTKTTYYLGDTLDTTGLVLTGTNGDGSTADDITTGYTCTPTVLNTLGTQVITVTYTEEAESYTTTFNVTVENAGLSSISITKNPNKTTYIHKAEELDLTGGKIELTYGTGSKNTIDMLTNGELTSGVAVSGYNKNIAGQQTITVTYTEDGVSKSATFNVTVQAVLEDIRVKTMPSKVNYFVGDTLDIAGLVIEGVNSDDTSAGTISTGYTCAPEELNTVGTQEITVTYTKDGKNFSTSFNVNVQKIELASITVKQNPDKTAYIHKADELDLTGGQIELTYNNGNKNTIDMLTDGVLTPGLTVSGYNKNTVGMQSVTVTYTEDGVSKSATFNVTVQAVLEDIRVKTMPSKVNYFVGDTLDTAGLVIEGVNSDGTSAGTLEGYTFNTRELNTVGTQEITVTYTEDGKNFSTSFNVNVQKIELASITVKQNPSKTTYIHKADELDLTGGQIELTYNNGNKNTINMLTSGELTSGLTVSGYNKNTVGEQIITVTYTEDGVSKSATFTVTVQAVLENIRVKTMPSNVNYFEGDTLDTTGLVIEGINSDGTSAGNITEYTCDPTELNTVGTQEITVTYTKDGKNFNTSFNVNVQKIELVSIAVTQNPNKTTYTQTVEDLNLAGGRIKLAYNNGNINNIDMLTNGELTSGLECSGYDKETSGKQTITLTYTDDGISKSTTFKVEVLPLILTYEENEDGTITLTNLEQIKAGRYIEIPSTIDGKTVTKIEPNSVKIKKKGTSIDIPDTIEYISPDFIIDLTKKTTASLDLTPLRKVASTNDVVYTLKVAEEDDDDEYDDDEELENIFVLEVNSTNTVLIAQLKEYGWNYVLKDKEISGISVYNNPNKTEYLVKEDFSISGGRLLVAYTDTSCDPSPIPMQLEDVICEGFDSTVDGTKTITVTYTRQGNSFVTTFNVVVKDYVTGIEVTSSSVDTLYGTSIDDVIEENDIKYVVTYEGKGEQEEVVLLQNMINGYSPTNPGIQYVTVTYVDDDINSDTYNESFEAGLSVNVINYLAEIQVKTMPEKVNYFEGETLNTAGLVIEGIKADGTSAGNLAGCTYSPTELNTVGTQTITVTYTEDGKEFNTTFNVNVQKIELASITVKQNPNKTTYIHKAEELDLTGGQIELTYNNGNKNTINMSTSGVTVSGYDKNTVGEQTITVTYTEDGVSKSTTFNVTVNAILERIEIKTMPSKVDYYEGDTLNTAGIEVEGINSDETSAGILSGYTYDLTALNTIGTQTITVTYTKDGKIFNTTFNVNVQKIELASITVKQNPSKTTYIHKVDELDLTGGQIELTYNNGNKNTINMSASGVAVSGYDKNTVGEQTITVTYTEDGVSKSATFTVTVNAILERIEVKTLPLKLNYFEGDTLNTAGIVIRGINSDETFAEIITACTYEPTVLNTVGTQTITVTYTKDGKEFTDTFNVTVQKIELASIAVKQNPSKTTYIHKVDELDLTGGQIELTYNNGNKNTINMSASGVAVSGYDKNTVGEQTITVTYTEDGVSKSATFNVTVSSILERIEVKTMPSKVDYFEGETLNTAGIEVEGINSDETSAGILTGCSYTPTALNTVGTQTITVTYTKDGKEFTDTFNVTVQKIELASVTVKQNPNKVNYLVKQELDLTGGQIELTYNNGNKNTINMSASGVTVSGYDKNVEGEQEITVTYIEDGVSKSVTFNVEVKDYVTEITVNPSNVNAIYGTSLEDIIANNNIKYVVKYELKGEMPEVELNTSMVTGYNPNNKQVQNLTVTYVDNDTNSDTYLRSFTTNLSVNVTNDVVRIDMTAPTKQEYNHGDTLDLSTMQITLTYEDETQASGNISEVIATEIDGTEVNMSPTNYDENNKVEKTIVLSLTKDNVTQTVNYTFSIENDLREISLKEGTYKTEYKLNEELDLTGTVIIVVRGTGEEEVTVTDEMVSGFDSTEVGSKTLTVSYGGKETTYIINVFNEDVTYEEILGGSGIEIKEINPKGKEDGTPENPSDLIEIPKEIDGKIVKKIGPYAINPARPGLTIRIPSTVEEISEHAFDGCDELTIECETGSVAQEYAIEYGFNYELIDQEIASISVYQMPDKQTYKIGEDLDLTGGKILVTYVDSNISASTISMKKYDVQITGFESETKGTKELTVLHKEKITTFEVTVINNKVESELTSDGTGIKITVIEPNDGEDEIEIPGIIDGKTVKEIGDYVINPPKSGLTVIIPSTVEKISEHAFDGCDELTIECETGSAAHEYAVEHGMNYELIDKEIENISMYVLPNKTVYEVEEDLDLTGGRLLLTYTDGATSPISIKKSGVVVSGYDKNIEGTQNLIVTYKGHETSFEVNVLGDYIKGISEATTVQELKENLGSNVDVKVYDVEENEISDEDYIGTGMIIEITQGEKTIRVRAIVKGDLDGDGRVTIVDVSRLQMHYMELQLLSQIETNPEILRTYEIAADTDEDGEIGIIDVSQIKMHYLGIQLFN